MIRPWDLKQNLGLKVLECGDESYEKLTANIRLDSAVSALKEKLDLLSRLPEPAIERAARTLLDLRESWEWATKEERKDLARMMIQEVGVDVAAKRVIWIKARPDFDVLFQLLNNLRVDEKRRFWIAYPEVDEDACDIREDLGQMGTEVKIAFPVSHNTLTIAGEYLQ